MIIGQIKRPSVASILQEKSQPTSWASSGSPHSYLSVLEFPYYLTCLILITCGLNAASIGGDGDRIVGLANSTSLATRSNYRSERISCVIEASSAT